MAVEQFDKSEEELGLVVKKFYTVIGKWPIRLQKRPGDVGGKEESKALITSAHSGMERYAEWN